jgi:hypothetical protein
MTTTKHLGNTNIPNPYYGEKMSNQAKALDYFRNMPKGAKITNVEMSKVAGWRFSDSIHELRKRGIVIETIKTGLKPSDVSFVMTEDSANVQILKVGEKFRVVNTVNAPKQLRITEKDETEAFFERIVSYEPKRHPVTEFFRNLFR